MISGSRVTIAESISTSKENSLALDALRSGFLDRPLNDRCKSLTERWTDWLRFLLFRKSIRRQFYDFSQPPTVNFLLAFNLVASSADL
jgi:transposase-like protein